MLKALLSHHIRPHRHRQRIKRIALVGALAVFAWGAVLLSPATTSADANRACDNPLIRVTGDSLAPWVPAGTVLIGQTGPCRDLTRGQLAIFRNAQHPQEPLIKKIAGVPGQTMRLVTESGTRHVEVAGIPVRAPDGAVYHPTTNGADMISLYTGRLRGYLMIGQPGSLDSGRFGLIPKDAIFATATPPTRGGAAKIPATPASR